MDREYPQWLRYKLSVVECRSLENVACGLTEAASEQDRLRGVMRENADFAATQNSRRAINCRLHVSCVDFLDHETI
jgi:hypothetical protein